MKTTRKLLILSFFCMTLSSLFLIPIAPAQTVEYNGADTESIPHFSVYPSEWYIYETYHLSDEPFYRLFEITHGNVSDVGMGYGDCVWATSHNINITTHVIYYTSEGYSLLGFWNDTTGLFQTSIFLPVESDGIVSERIFNNVSSYYENNVFANPNWFDYNESNYDDLTIRYWNEIANDYSYNTTWGSDGVLLSVNETHPSMPNMTLYSRPAQLPPTFFFTTTSGLSTVSSSQISLGLTIPDADNNNDGLADIDYQYRVFESGVWSDWAVVTPFIDYDLGSVSAGNYTLTVEAKNMYGTTQEQIEVEYAPTSSDAIPGYSAVLILVVLGFSISILLSKYRKKL